MVAVFLAQLEWENLARRAPDQLFVSDASGSFGCGAVWGSAWFQFRWSEGYLGQSIAMKELAPIVMACAVWGRHWHKQAVQVNCDNQAVVEVVNSGSCRDSHLMRLLRTLFFITAHFECSVRAVHIAGRDNCALSRDRMFSFFAQAPGANPAPTPLPDPLVDLLISQCPDWTSQSWCRLFSTFLKQV